MDCSSPLSHCCSRAPRALDAGFPTDHRRRRPDEGVSALAYERRSAGELVHVDIKQLGRISEHGAGHGVTGNRKSQAYRRIDGRQRQVTRYEYVHVMVDDHSRLAYAEVLDDLTARCAIAFLRRAVAWFGERGVRIRAVMTDNGSCYVAHAHRAVLRELGLRHLRIKPGRPRTNGKAERFIQTLLNVVLRARLREYGRAQGGLTALPRPLQLQTSTRLPRQTGSRDEVDQPPLGTTPRPAEEVTAA